MRKTKQLAIAMLLTASLCTPVAAVNYLTEITAEAHSGRTDARGGHRDNKNKSGLGSYHYHCGGYPAHLHENGVCPYGSGATTHHTSASNPGSVPKTNKKETSNTPQVTTETMDAYALVFDADYYYNAYPDLQNSIGRDSGKLFEHFCSNGMAEGRRGNGEFSPTIYKENNPDLVNAYGDDWKQYYEHYRQTGHEEGRVHNEGNV